MYCWFVCINLYEMGSMYRWYHLPYAFVHSPLFTPHVIDCHCIIHSLKIPELHVSTPTATETTFEWLMISTHPKSMSHVWIIIPNILENTAPILENHQITYTVKCSSKHQAGKDCTNPPKERKTIYHYSIERIYFILGGINCYKIPSGNLT